MSAQSLMLNLFPVRAVYSKMNGRLSMTMCTMYDNV